MQLPVVGTPIPAISQFETGPKSISAVRVLRISLTDRCNFRCVYCMPEEGVRWLPREQILSFEEITDVVRAAVEIHGIRRFKLTGGEPTVRRGLLDLIRMLRRIRGIEDLSLTTNGMLLESLAHPLKEAGLDRITISIDSLRSHRFRQITRTGDLATVMRGLDCSEDAGFSGLKINCVTMRGSNDDEFADFARMTSARRLTVRFIEYMPLGDAALMHVSDRRIDASEIGPAAGCGGAGPRIGCVHFRKRSERTHRGGTRPIGSRESPKRSRCWAGECLSARHRPSIGPRWFYQRDVGAFCATCNRLRLTADGVLRSCLFEGGEVPIRDLLRSTIRPDERLQGVANAMAECIRLKPDVHSGHGNQQMSRIGG